MNWERLCCSDIPKCCKTLPLLTNASLCFGVNFFIFFFCIYLYLLILNLGEIHKLKEVIVLSSILTLVGILYLMDIWMFCGNKKNKVLFGTWLVFTILRTLFLTIAPIIRAKTSWPFQSFAPVGISLWTSLTAYRGTRFCEYEEDSQNEDQFV